MTFMLESRWTRVMPAAAQGLDMSAGTHKGVTRECQSRCQLEDAGLKVAEAGGHAPYGTTNFFRPSVPLL